MISPSMPRSEEHTSELQSHSDLHSFPTRRSSDLDIVVQRAGHIDLSAFAFLSARATAWRDRDDLAEHASRNNQIRNIVFEAMSANLNRSELAGLLDWYPEVDQRCASCEPHGIADLPLTRGTKNRFVRRAKEPASEPRFDAWARDIQRVRYLLQRIGKFHGDLRLMSEDRPTSDSSQWWVKLRRY